MYRLRLRVDGQHTVVEEALLWDASLGEAAPCLTSSVEQQWSKEKQFT